MNYTDELLLSYVIYLDNLICFYFAGGRTTSQNNMKFYFFELK